MRVSLAVKKKKSDVSESQESSLRRAVFLFPYSKVEFDFNMNHCSGQEHHEIFIHIFIRQSKPPYFTSGINKNQGGYLVLYSFHHKCDLYLLLIGSKTNFSKRKSMRSRDAMLCNHRDFLARSIWGKRMNQKRNRHEDTIYLAL